MHFGLGKSYNSRPAENLPTIARMAKDKNPLHLAISKRIVACMGDAHIPTRQALADALELEMTRVKNWTNGSSAPTLVELIRLCEFFSVTTDWMLTGTTTGLTEGKRIRLQAIQSGIAIPKWAIEELPEKSASNPVKTASIWSKRVKDLAKQNDK